MSRSGRREAGFTLIELLVSLVLLALLTTALLGGFRFATGPLQRQAARFEDENRLSVVYGFLRSRLADARPIAPVNGDTGAVAFDGRRNSVAFLTAGPQGGARGGLYLFSIDADAGQLRASWRLFEGLLPAAEEEAGDTVLLDRVRRIDLGYYGARLSDPGLAWQTEWRGEPYLPLLVRFEFVLASGERLPALVVAPRPQPLRAVPVAPAPAIASPR